MAGFLDSFGAAFGTTTVVRINNLGTDAEDRTELECLLQSKHAKFEVSAPVYEGDYLEIPDPRNADDPMLKYVSNVEIFNTPKMSDMAHLKATLTDRPPSPRPDAPPIVNNTNIVVHGGNNQFAVGNISATQATEIAAGVSDEYKALANRVAAIIRDLEDLEIDDDNREAILSTSKSLLDQLASDEPDTSLVRRLGIFLKNALAGAAYATGAGTSDAIQDFVETHLHELLSSLSVT